MSEELEWELFDIFEAGLFAFPLYEHQTARRIIRYLMYRGVLAEEIADAIEDSTADLYIWLNRSGKNMVGEWVIAWVNDSREEYKRVKMREAREAGYNWVDHELDSDGGSHDGGSDNDGAARVALRERPRASRTNSGDSRQVPESRIRPISNSFEETSDEEFDSTETKQRELCPPPLPPPRPSLEQMIHVRIEAPPSGRMHKCGSLEDTVSSDLTPCSMDLYEQTPDSGAVSDIYSSITAPPPFHQSDASLQSTNEIEADADDMSCDPATLVYLSEDVRRPLIHLQRDEIIRCLMNLKRGDATVCKPGTLQEIEHLQELIDLLRDAEESVESKKEPFRASEEIRPVSKGPVCVSEKIIPASKGPVCESEEILLCDSRHNSKELVVDSVVISEALDSVSLHTTDEQIIEALQAAKGQFAKDLEITNGPRIDSPSVCSEESHVEALNKGLPRCPDCHCTISYYQPAMEGSTCLEDIGTVSPNPGSNADQNTEPNTETNTETHNDSSNETNTGTVIRKPKFANRQNKPSVGFSDGTISASESTNDKPVLEAADNKPVRADNTVPSAEITDNKPAPADTNILTVETPDEIPVPTNHLPHSETPDTDKVHPRERNLSRAMEISIQTLDKDGPGYIFIITDNIQNFSPWSDNQRYKIASSRQPERWLNEFRSRSIDVDLIWQVKVKSHVKAVAEVHAHLRVFNVHSNWYRCSLSTIMETISQVVRKYRD